MRIVVVVIILAALIVAAGSYWRSAGGLGADASTTDSKASPPARELVADSGESGIFPDDATESPASSTTYYQWVDERGSVHFVTSIEEVPANWRSRAGRVELDPAAFTKTTASTAKAVRQPPVVEVEDRRRSHDVTVYTAPWCGWCRKTIAFLDDQGVDYVNKDIEADEAYAAELREKSGRTSIPFVEIDGTQIRGYNPGEMASLLK